LRHHPHFTAYLALACVCFFWGTTYLAIRIAVEEIPPAALMSVRYLISGGVMLAGAWAKGAQLPRGRELRRTALFGVMTIGFGTGTLVIAEQFIPSGLSALLITTSPFWLVGVEALLPGGEPLHAPTIGGMLVGAFGVAFLVSPGGLVAGDLGRFGLLGWFLLLQFGCMVWSLGSILQRRQAASEKSSSAHPFVSGAVQQVATGLAFVIPALLGPPVHWTTRSIAATAYLVVFGGIVGYSAFVMIMERLPVAVASIYTYVNPLIAVLLGVLLYHEPFLPREVTATAAIFVGITLVKRATGKQQRQAAKLAQKTN
jgi:drug/metabolite transporter (DMT)-like permease